MFDPGIEMLVCDTCRCVYCLCNIPEHQMGAPFGGCLECQNYTEIWTKMTKDPRLYKQADEFFKKYLLYIKCDPRRGIPHTIQEVDTSHKGNGTHNGLFVGTLTMSPNDPYNEEDMIGAMRKIFAQQTVPVKKWAWYREYTKNGIPHIHFCYETEQGGRIHKKIFQRYWKIWDEPRNQTGRGGFPGGYHSPAKSEIAYLEYMSKDGGRSGFKGFKLENEILQKDN